jgi:hypothetical protein
VEGFPGAIYGLEKIKGRSLPMAYSTSSNQSFDLAAFWSSDAEKPLIIAETNPDKDAAIFCGIPAKKISSCGDRQI